MYRAASILNHASIITDSSSHVVMWSFSVSRADLSAMPCRNYCIVVLLGIICVRSVGRIVECQINVTAVGNRCSQIR